MRNLEILMVSHGISVRCILRRSVICILVLKNKTEHFRRGSIMQTSSGKLLCLKIWEILKDQKCLIQSLGSMTII